MDPDVRLRRHPDFTVQGTSLRHDVITGPAGQQVRSPHALSVMALFATPTTIREAAGILAAQMPTTESWVAAMNCIKSCYSAGILATVDTPAPVADAQGFALESQHVIMLNDTARTKAFINAIQASVTPGDVVLDIGTGTGVLAMAAARAGAAHVYAVEQSAIADVAEAGFESNGFAERITLIRGRSTEISLPQLASVVVAEVIGDDLFDENILPTMADATARLTTPDARFIPQSIRPVVIPLRLPAETLDTHRYSRTHTDQWNTDYGFDFDWLLNPALRSPGVHLELRLHVVRDTQCGPAIAMPELHFGGDERFYSETVPWPGDETANAIAVAFSSDLGHGIELTTNPDAAVTTSWSVLAWIPLATDLTSPGRVTVTSTRGRSRVSFAPSTRSD